MNARRFKKDTQLLMTAVLAALAGISLYVLLLGSGKLLAQDAQAGGGTGKLVIPANHIPKCTTMVTPNYPQVSATDKVATAVTLRVIIRASGSVTPLYLVIGKPQFEQAAMNAVRLWRYKPYVVNGVPVDITTVLIVDFDPGVQGGFVTHPSN